MALIKYLTVIGIIIPGILASGISYSDILTTDEPINSPTMYIEHHQLWQLDMSNQTSYEFPKDRVLLIHKNLARYFCNNCSVHSIYKQSFSMLPQLTHLKLDHNNLSHIHPDAFENNPVLHTVQLVGNNLVRFNPEGILRHVTSLTILDLDHNPGFDINQVQMRLNWLMYFSCKHCNTSYVDKSTMSRWQRLGHLHLPNNHIDRIDQDAFLEMSRFKRLNVKGNKKLSKVSFHSNTLLHLDAEDCGLEGTLDTSSLPSLEIINVRSNKISRIQERGFQNSENIKRILLDDNEIEKIPEKLLQLPLYKLEALCIDRNPLQTREILESFIAKYDSKKLRRGCLDDENPSKQFELNLPSKNGVALYSKLFDQHLVAENTAELSLQNITYIEHDLFENMSEITRVIMDNNTVFDLPTRKVFLQSNFITELSLKNCAITSVHDETFKLLPNIKSLNLEGNRIKSLHSPKVFENTANLEHLNLAHNELDFLAPNLFRDLKALRTVHLCHNRLLTTEPGTYFLISTSIEKLTCRFCGLTQIDPYTLSGLKRLKELDFSNNKITSVDENTFRWSKHLQQLDLSHNHLQTFEPDLLQFEHLRTMCLAGNEKINLPESRIRELEMMCNEKIFTTNLTESFEDPRRDSLPEIGSIVRDESAFNLGTPNTSFNCRVIVVCILLSVLPRGVA